MAARPAAPATLAAAPDTDTDIGVAGVGVVLFRRSETETAEAGEEAAEEAATTAAATGDGVAGSPPARDSGGSGGDAMPALL